MRCLGAGWARLGPPGGAENVAGDQVPAAPVSVVEVDDWKWSGVNLA